MRTQLILAIMLAAPTVGCGSLYGNYDDAEYDDGYGVQRDAPTDDGYADAASTDEDAVVDDDGAFEAGEDVASVDVFYDALDDHGVWQQDAEYGYVFAPYADDYVPYTDGYWVETEYGQTWVATDAIGWAVCHYGRWIYRDRWLWVPDTVWGPAWVDWRIGGGWVGWAPLGYGSYAVPYYSWRFVADDYLYARNLRSYYRRVHDIRHIYPRTHRVDRYVRGRNGQRYVAGPAHVGGRHAERPRARLRDLPARGTGRHAARAERDRRGAERRPASYRASRAHSERMSRAGLDPSRRTYRTPSRRYNAPSHTYTSPRQGDRPARRYDARRRTTPRAYAPRGDTRRGTATPNRGHRRSGYDSPTRAPRAPTYRGGGSRRAPPAAGSSSSRRAPSKARSSGSRSPSRARAPGGGGGRRGHSGGRHR